MTGFIKMSGMNKMTRMAGRSGVTVMTRMPRTFQITCLADGKKFPELLLTDLFEYWPNKNL